MLAGLNGAVQRRRRARASESAGEPSRACSPTFNKSAGGSSGRFFRALLMDEPPSLDNGELTDKGSINQRAVLAHRAALIDELYADPPSHRIIR